MTVERYLMDIPLYWRTEEDFNRRFNADLECYLRRNVSGIELTVAQEMDICDRFREIYVAPWRFNQIVGWLRVYIVGTQVRGEIWFINSRRFGTNLRKKQFAFKGNAFEIETRPEDSDIYDRVLKSLMEYDSYGSRRVYPDLEGFQEYGPFIDWQHLIHRTT